MSMNDSTVTSEVAKVIGLADLCELMSVTFAYPSKEDLSLAQALSDGSYASDAVSCLKDAGASGDDMDAVRSLLDSFAGRAIAELHEELRQGHSILFQTPGGETPVWAYEAPFKYVAAGREGSPSLFRSPATVDVEQLMAKAGNPYTMGLHQPADSIWAELAHMSFLLGSLAQALARNDTETALCYRQLACEFVTKHLGTWGPQFMELTVREASSPTHSHGAEYASLAKLGSRILRLVIGMITGEDERR